MPLLDCPVGFCNGDPAADQDASLGLRPCERGGACPRCLDLDSLKAAEVRKRTLRAVQSQNVAKLAALLDEAKSAHTRWEEQHGHDPDWPRWYASYLLGGVTA